MTDYRAIPTMYKGIRFRSRLEATWAAFFDQIGWPWQYEPIDLKGYIPDFLVALTIHGEHTLIEVKPALSTDALLEHTAKIEASGWMAAAVIVGTHLMARTDDPGRRLLGVIGLPVSDLWLWEDGPALEVCPFCHAVTTFEYGPGCARCARTRHDAVRLFDRAGVYALPARVEYLDRLWAMAKNLTQWHPGPR